MFPAIFEVDMNGEATGAVSHFCSASCLAQSAKSSETFIVDTSTDAIAGETCAHCGNHLTSTVPAFTYFNQCDRWRIRYDNGEECWQDMMANKTAISLEAFLLLVDASGLLDEDETVMDFVADDPDHGFFVSIASGTPVVFLANAGFEFIFTENGAAP